MNKVAAVPFHTGPELGRAINRTDFFRLLKSATEYYRFDHFALLRLSDAGSFGGSEDGAITNISEKRIPLFVQTMKQVLTLAKARNMQLMTAPYCGRSEEPEEYSTDLVLNEFRGSCFLLIPLFTPEGKRYFFITSGSRPTPDQAEIAEVLLDVMQIFNKLYEEILSAQVSGRLTQREIEIVKWTSEGKTSADIAIILGLSEHTVNSHITAAARKLDAVNRVHMVAIALRKGLVS